MSLLWCDGFDHYGVAGNLTEGVYADAAGIVLSTANPRTGSYHLRFSGGNDLRRVLGGAKTTVGTGAVIYMSSLPNQNNQCTIFAFHDAANAAQIQIVVQTTGTISVFRGNKATLLDTTAAPVVTAEAYQHIECMVTFSQTVGTVEVRVNGVTVTSLTGIDTVASSLVECSQLVFCDTGSAAMTIDMDDLYAYDSNGSYNNTFIGDRRVLTLKPNANTIQADWTAVGAATGYECIDDTTPDGDTTYIGASVAGSPGAISEFGLEDLPDGISAISAVYLVGMMRKTEAGDADIQMSVVSGVVEGNGTNRPITEIYTYFGDVFETDPATAAPFTPSAVDDLLIKIERTA